MGHPIQTREKIARLQRELDQAKRALAVQVENCVHQWGETEYTPDIRKAYSTPNTMGPIQNGRPVLADVHVPRKETPKWTRTCTECEESETTTETTKKVSETPRF